MEVAKRVHDNLICCPIVDIYKKSAELDESAKSSKKGTLLGFKTAGDKLKVIGEETGLTPCCILAEDLVEDETVGVVFESGVFNLDMIITKNEHTVSEEEKDTLKKYGIRFETMITGE